MAKRNKDQSALSLIPVFVYGTLREGHGNYFGQLRGRVDKIERATLDGFQMFSLGAFPGIVPGKGKIVGDVMYIKPELYPIVMANLDSLEGYKPKTPQYSMYLRQLHTVQLEDGRKIQAYVYVWNGAPRGEIIESGDWEDYESKNSWRGYYRRKGAYGGWMWD